MSRPILYLRLSLPGCIAMQSQIVLQIVSDSRLLAGGDREQSEADRSFVIHLTLGCTSGRNVQGIKGDPYKTQYNLEFVVKN